MAKTDKKKKKSNLTVLIAVASAVIAILTVYLYSQIFADVKIIVPKENVATIKPFSELKAADFAEARISKMDMKYFKDIVTDFNQIKGKVAVGDIQPGLPMKKSSFIDIKSPKNLSSTITSVDGRDTLLYIKNPYALNGTIQTGSVIDLYMVMDDTKLKDTIVYPVKNLLKIKQKIAVDGGCYLLVETQDILSEQYILTQYMILNKGAVLAATLPGLNPTDYKGKVLRWSDLMKQIDPNYGLIQN